MNIKVAETINAAKVKEFAKATGLPRTTVAYWRDENKVPAWRVDTFLRAARKLKIDPANPQIEPKRGRA